MCSNFEGLPIDEQIARIGHRAYVGGTDAETWYGIGRLQYHLLVAAGLRPHHKFLDVACGSLRLGQFVIPYLSEGNYYGLEGAERLVQDGLREELSSAIVEIKRPRFFFNYEFDVEVDGGFEFALAQSLFTHLVLRDIEKCFRKLRPVAANDARFFFTFHPWAPGSPTNPADLSHAQKNWHYTPLELMEVAEFGGWVLEVIGDWGHPRGQHLALAQPR